VAAIFGVAVAVDRALRDNGVERADARLASALRASSDALNARVARASAEAERLATSRRVQRALAAEDRAELAAVTRAWVRIDANSPLDATGMGQRWQQPQAL
jgi:hypothetical protein